jgi:alpha-1,2-mannosyltransferase
VSHSIEVAGRERDRRRAFEAARLALVAIVPPLLGWILWTFALRLGANDFHDYWLAGRLVLDGRSPYDITALRDLAAQQHLSFEVGGGYSYPLPFALAMVPLAALPFEVALVIFNAASLVAFGLTVAAWIVWDHAGADDPADGRRRLALALGAGLYPPVYGTVVNGQANLIVLPLLALGAVLALDGAGARRRAAGGLLLGLAAVVKLVPAVLVVPLALARRFGAAAGLVAGGVGALALAVAVAPWAAAGSGGLASNLDPDSYYTNQSINGFVTRLVEPTSRTSALFPQAFDPRPAMIVLTAILAAATAVVLWRYRSTLATRRGAALGLGLAVVAGVAGAPKDSFWNESLCLVAVGLLIAVDAPDLTLSRFGRVDGGLLAAWFGGAVVWAAVWAVEPARGGVFAAPVNLLWSASLFGLLALWLLFARRIRRPQPLDRASRQTAPASTIS